MSKSNDNWNSFFDDDNLNELDLDGDFEDAEAEAAWNEILNEPEDAFDKVAAPKDTKNIEEDYDERPNKNSRPKSAKKEFKDISDEYLDEYDEIRAAKKPKKKKKKKKSGGTKSAVIILGVIIGMCLLIGAVIFVAKSCGGRSSGGASDVNDIKWEESTNKEILSLVNSYYAARVLKDTYTLKEILDPSITIDEAALENEADVVEGYQNIACYTSAGPKDGSYIVYVTYSIKFKKIATAAPGLVVAYIYTDEAAKLRLVPRDNLVEGEEIYQYIQKVSTCDYIKNLAKVVNENYDKALLSDAALYDYVKKSGGRVPEKEETPQTSAFADEQETTAFVETTAAPETTKAQEQSTTAADTSDFEPYDNEMFVTKDQVNVRKGPSTDTEVVKSLSKGQKVYTVAKNSSWYKVSLADGSTAYIAKDFLSSDKPN